MKKTKVRLDELVVKKGFADTKSVAQSLIIAGKVFLKEIKLDKPGYSISTNAEISSDYPDVELSHQLADNTAMQLVLDPNQFDVIVASNLFGDILSDIAATLTGSIGMLPSASLDSSFKGMYEPCHGSAPDIAGKDIANPIAMISSLSMALKYSLNEENISDKIDLAIKKFVEQGYRTVDIATEDNYLKTSEVSKKIIEIIENE